MARSTRSTKNSPTQAPARQPRRSATMTNKQTKAPVVATPAPVVKTIRQSVASKPAAKPISNPAALSVPKLSKGELREQVEKLEQANAKLRAKSRESNKLAKSAAKRITELEEQVGQLEQEAARRAPMVKEVKSKTQRPRRTRSIDPGDGALPETALQDPEPLEGAAKTVPENA